MLHSIFVKKHDDLDMLFDHEYMHAHALQLASGATIISFFYLIHIAYLYFKQ